MSAIVSGNSLGLGLTSLKTLGQVWGAKSGQGDTSYVNVFNGNLILQERDDFLVARGGGYQALRTYNSQGQFNDDNGDNWSTGLYRQQISLTGAIGQAGSTLTRLERDGGQSLYRWDAVRACYISTDGAGAYNRIRIDGDTYVWSDGANTVQETYARSSGRLSSSVDVQGNRLDYSFDANGNLARVTNGNGDATCYDYSGNNLTQIRDITADGRVQTRTRYAYDAQNRLSAVTVDLTPTDNAVTDGGVYTTRYTYDGDSKRVTTIARPDGSQLKFSYLQVNGDADVWRIAGATDGLGQTTRYTYDANATTVTDALGQSTVYAYDAAGQLTSVTAPPVAGTSGVTRYRYNALGDVVQIIDAQGNAIDMGFDANGNQIRQQDAAGNLIERRYDERNQLIAETLSNSKTGEAAQTMRYVYDAGNRNLLRFTLSAGGRVTESRYDSDGQRINVLQHGTAYDLSKVAATDLPDEATMAAWVSCQDAQSAQRTDLQYDARGQLSKTTTYDTLAADGTGSATGAASVHYIYDQTGQLLKTIAGTGGVTTYAYDGLGRLIAQDVQGQLSSTSYDDIGNSVVTTAANGLSTTRLYDAAGRLLSVTQSGGGTTLGTTRYTYDAANRLVLSEDPLGNRQRILYDAAGRQVADIDAQGALTEYSYNPAGQRTRTRSYATPVAAALLADQAGKALFPDLAAIRPAAAAADHVTWRTYDAAGRLSKEINALGAVTVLQYDAAGHLIGTTRYATLIDIRSLPAVPADADIQPASGNQDRVTRHFYEDGFLRGTLDAEGYLTEIVYDNAGQIIRQIRYATATVAAQRAGGILADLRPAQSANDLIERTLRNNRGQAVGAIDAQDYLTETRFDANGNVARTIRYANPALSSTLTTLTAVRPASNAQDRVQSNDYDQSNRLIAQTDPQGSITRYRYDLVGNLIATDRATDRAADTAEVRHLLARYDLQGRLTGELSAVGAALLTDSMTAADIDALWKQYGVKHAYDAMGHRISATEPDGRQTAWIYDANGRLTHTINALGEVAETRYDSFGQVSATVQYDQRLSNASALALGVRSQLDTALAALRQDGNDSRVSYRYDSLGLQTERSEAINTSTQRYYNSFGELIRQDRIDGSTGVARAIADTQQRDRRGQVIETVADAGRTHLITRTQYDAFGRAVQSIDPRGNITKTDYDRLGRQIAMTDAIGGKVATVYDAFARIVSQNDHGAVTSYRYDAVARSTVLTTPDNVTITTTYSRHGQTQSVTDGRGTVTRFDYDANGNLITRTQGDQRTSNRYDAGNRLIESIDADGRKVVMQYDAVNRLITRTVDPDNLKLVTSTTYDARGRQIGVTTPNGVKTQFDYDSQGRLLRQTVDPDGLKLTTRTSYDADGNIVSVTSPNGSVTQYQYDGAGRRVQEVVDPNGLKLTRSYRFDANGNLTHVTDANGNVIRYAYDQMNRPVWTVNAQGAAQKTVYDGSSMRIVQQTTYAKALTIANASDTLDAAQLSSTIVADAQDVVTLRRYDAMGRLSWQIDAGGGVQKTDYDANGNAVRRTAYATALTAAQLATLKADPAAVPTPTANAATDNVQRSFYDARNRLRYSIDSAGAVVEQRYDAAGNVIERIAYSKKPADADTANHTLLAAALKKGADPASDMRSRLVYDGAGRLQFEVNAQGGVTERRVDANGNVQQQIGYATLLSAEVQQGALTVAGIKAGIKSDAADRISTTLYDAANRARYQIDSLGYVTQQELDANGNPGKTIRYAKPATVARNADGSLQLSALTRSAQDVVDYKHYDAANRLRLKIDGLGYVTENRYDNLGNITSIVNYSQVLAANVKRDDLTAVRNALGMSVTPTKDDIGSTAASVAPTSGATLIKEVNLRRIDLTPIAAPVAAASTATTTTVLSQLQADTAPTVSHTRIRYVYDAAGNLTKSTDALGNSETYAYNALGQRTSFTNKLGAVTTYVYDNRNNLIKTTDALGKTETVAYDSLNRRLSFTDKLGATTTYTYDVQGNLLTATDALGNSERYAYDLLRNRIGSTNKLGGATRTTYDALGRKTSETLPVSSKDAAGAERAIVNRMSYDAFGNRIAVIDAADLPEERTIRYTFDALGRPLTQIGQTTSIYIAGTGWQTVAPTETTRYDSRGNIVDRADANGNHTRLFYDADNRVIAEVSTTGTLITRNFDAAGNVLSQRIYGDTLPAATVQTATDEPPLPVNANNYRETRFVYDANNRLTETIQAQVGFAERNDATGNLTYAVGDLATRTTYNAQGQAVMNQDGAGRRSYLYYNLLGQKVLGIDAAGYATSWQYDAASNVSSQHAYAIRIPADIPYTESSDAQSLLAQLPVDTKDRITDFSYDALGRQSTQTQRNVASSILNDRGQLTDKTDAVITRTGYDAIGDIISKTDGAGNVTNWQYDLQGRKTGTLLPTVTDYSGKTVRQTTTYQYNGLHQLIKETQEGNGGSGANNDAAHVVTHQYDQAGRRLSQTLATGDVIRYGYDANGNTTAEILDRKQADGSTVHEMTSIAYDAAGREIRRNVGAVDQTNTLAATGGGSGNSVSSVRYDAYGNLVSKQTESGNTKSEAQQFTEYDAAGRIWRSNVDSGITKVYLYDRNGRPTVTLQSQTLDLRSMTLEQMQTEMGKIDSRIATTITIYDERGQVIRTIQPKMTSNRPNAALMALQGGGTFEGVQLVSGSTLVKGGATAYTQSAPAVADSAGNIGISTRVRTTTVEDEMIYNMVKINISGYWNTFGVEIDIPDFSAVYGKYKIIANASALLTGVTQKIVNGVRVDVPAPGTRVVRLPSEVAYTSPGKYLLIEEVGSLYEHKHEYSEAIPADISYKIDLYVLPENGIKTHLATISQDRVSLPNNGFGVDGYGVFTTQTASNSSLLKLNNQTLAAARKVELYYRTAGSTGAYAKLATSVMSGQSGTYIANVAGMSGNYDMLMVAVDKDGKVLRSDRLGVNRANNTVTRTSGVANGGIFEGNVMHLAGLQLGNGKLATSLTYKLGSAAPVTLAARDGIPGLFDIPTGAAAANLELVLTAADGSTDNLVGSINPATGVTNLQYLKYADSSLVFSNLDKNATRLEIKYREEGQTDWIAKTLTRTPGNSGNTTWLWDTQSAGLVPDKNKSYRYEIAFDAYDNDGTKLNNGSAAIAAGNIAGGNYTSAAITGSARPRWVGINSNVATAATLTVRYRLKGSSDAYATATLSRLPSGTFKLDTSALPLDKEYEFTYDAKDAAGKTVASSKGYFRSEAQQQVTDGTNVQWMIGLDDDIKSETQVKRSQSYDAFGNIVSETDGNGNTVEFEYNVLGQMTIKRDAATDITLDNGYIVKGTRTETNYSYDAAGNLIGTRDANGNLNTQRWTMGGERAQVSQEWHADGGIRKNAYDVFGNLRSTVNEDNQQTDYRYDANNRLVAMDRPVSAGIKATDHFELDVKGQRIAVTNALGYRSSTRYDSLGRVAEVINAEGRKTAYGYTYDNTIASVGGLQTGGWRRVMTDANGRTQTDDLDTTGRVLRHVDLGGRVFSYTYNYSGLIQRQSSTNGQDIDYRYYGNGYLQNVIDRGVGTTATYEYDNNGNRTFEGYMADNGQFAFQQQTVSYDARNRIVSIRDPRYDITYEYDALGNRRHMRSVYTNGLGIQLAEQDYWYKYDAMSRFTISMGQLSGARATAANGATSIVRGTSGDGVAFTYTQAGLRASASYAPNPTTTDHTESYYYDGRGLLNQTRLSDGSSIVRTTDLGGRVTTTKTTDGTGKVLQNSTRTWTKDNQLLQEHDNLGNKGTKYELLSDGTVSASQTYSADAKDTTTRTTFTYDWWDSAKQTSISVQARNSTVDSWKKVWQPGFSQFTYDVNGHSKLAWDETGKRAFTYWTDTDGQVLKRQELIGGTYDQSTGKMNGASKAREHGYYYLDGHRIGDVGNDQTERADYAQELTSLRSNDGRRSYEKFTPSNAADFDANYQPINSDYPAATPTAYTVRAGDTLQSIARALWGDATLWYMLAEANGLIGTQPSAALTHNSTLVIPNQVTNIHNTSATFKPYSPGKALGDTMPTLPSAPPPPPPPSKGGCGGIGQILTIVVIIVATVFTAGAASLAMAGTLGSTLGAAGGLAATMGAGMTAIAGGSMMAAAVGAAVGSVVGQGFAIATGQQDNFSWKSVGMSALGGALSAGVGSALQGSSVMNSIGQATSQMGQTMAQAAIGNIATQGIMTATGLQNNFDWRGVAASAAAAGVGYAVGKAANTLMNYNPQANGQGFDWGKQFASNTVSGIAAGATYAKLHGDEINAGRLIAGSAVYGAVSASMSEQQLMQAKKEAQQTAVQRAINAPGMTEAGYWNQSRNTADQYADTFGGSATATRGSANSVNRDAEMQRLMTQAQEPQYQAAGSDLRFTVEGVANDFPTDLNQYQRIGTDEAGRPLLQMPGIQVNAGLDNSPYLPSSEIGLQGFFAGLRGESSVMETESTTKMLGRYTGMAGEIVNQMFNPKEIARGMWTAIDSGNPIEIGLAGMGFFPMGNIAKVPGAIERGLLRSTHLETEISRIGQEGHAIARHGGAVTDSKLFTRATTGVAPDGSFTLGKGGLPYIPPSSTAFHSNELLAQSDLFVRQNYLEQAIALKPGATTIAIEGVEIGMPVGRGFDSVSKIPGAVGPLQFNNNMSRVTAAYKYDPVTAAWRTTTIYPGK